MNIHTAFHQAQYQSVIDFDTTSLSSANTLPARILKLRAQCALHDYSAVLSSTNNSSSSSSPDLSAIRAYARYASTGDSSAVATASSLADSASDNLTVQLMCSAVLARAGETEKALGLLAQHEGSLDAVALMVQIHLQQNRVDLAAKEAKSARSFAQDALLVNLAESWVGLREVCVFLSRFFFLVTNPCILFFCCIASHRFLSRVYTYARKDWFMVLTHSSHTQGGEKYQQSFYVFEELAQSPSSTSATSLIAQAVSELHLQRYPEAETALQQALELEPENADAIANSVVLNTLLGREDEAAKQKAKLEGGEHGFVTELERKRESFAEACAKYSPKFEL